jgi:hypothetical protein
MQDAAAMMMMSGHDPIQILASGHGHGHGPMGRFPAPGHGHSHCHSHSHSHSSARCRSERAVGTSHSHSSPSLAGHYDLLLQHPPSADALLSLSAPHSGSMAAFSAHSGILCHRCGEELGSRAAYEEHTLTYHSGTCLVRPDPYVW